MGKIKQGILGAVSGKVGGVIGSTWKGIAYLKVMPASVANPNTAAQQSQRGSFAGIVMVASVLLSQIVKPLWDRFAQFESGYNAFVSANIKTFVNGVFTNFSDFIISRGKLVGAENLAFTASNNDPVIGFSWDDNTGEGDALATDKPYMVVYNETQGNWGQNAGAKDRAFGSETLEMPTPVATNDILHVYFGFRRLDGTSVSDSQYLTGEVPV